MIAENSTLSAVVTDTQWKVDLICTYLHIFDYWSVQCMVIFKTTAAVLGLCVEECLEYEKEACGELLGTLQPCA